MKIAIILLLLPLTLSAWWNHGHELVAAIAEQNISPETRSRINTLFPEDKDLVAIASEADVIAEQNHGTKPWHYIDMPVRENVTRQTVDRYRNEKGNDIISQLHLRLSELKNPGLDKKKREYALLFVVHLMGDLHMPLHCSDDRDLGGNRKWVIFSRPDDGRQEKFKLHAFWDQLPDLDFPGDPDSVAKAINRATAGVDKQNWRKGDIEDWALESYGIAKNRIYNNLPAGPSDTPVALPPDICASLKPVVRIQLERAGLRLAAVLDNALSK